MFYAILRNILLIRWQPKSWWEETWKCQGKNDDHFLPDLFALLCYIVNRYSKIFHIYETANTLWQEEREQSLVDTHSHTKVVLGFCSRTVHVHTILLAMKIICWGWKYVSGNWKKYINGSIIMLYLAEHNTVNVMWTSSISPNNINIINNILRQFVWMFVVWSNY